MQVAYDVRPQMAYGLRRTDCVGHDPKLHSQSNTSIAEYYPNNARQVHNTAAWQR